MMQNLTESDVDAINAYLEADEMEAATIDDAFDQFVGDFPDSKSFDTGSAQITPKNHTIESGNSNGHPDEFRFDPQGNLIYAPTAEIINGWSQMTEAKAEMQAVLQANAEVPLDALLMRTSMGARNHSHKTHSAHRTPHAASPRTPQNHVPKGSGGGVGSGGAQHHYASQPKSEFCRYFPNCKYGNSCRFIHPHYGVLPAPYSDPACVFYGAMPPPPPSAYAHALPPPNDASQFGAPLFSAEESAA